MSGLILQDVVDQTVSNTTTETNVFVGTIPAGSLVGNLVAIEQTGRYQNNNQNGRSFTTRLYIGSSSGAGGTEVTEYAQTTAASTLGHAVVQRWDMTALDADSLRLAHRCGFGAAGSDDGAASSATNPTKLITNRVEGLSGLTGDTEIRITVQLSATGASHKFDSRGVWVGLVDMASSSSDLVIQDASHAHAADNLALTQVHSLAVADASHGHAADNLALTQVHTLAIQDASHAHTADNLTLAAGGDATLVIAKATHGHAADGLALTQVHQLVVSEASHAHAADGMNLAQTHILQISEGHHAHTADQISLLGPTTLQIQDAHHAMTSDVLSVSAPFILSKEGPFGGNPGAGPVTVLSHEGPS